MATEWPANSSATLTPQHQDNSSPGEPTAVYLTIETVQLIAVIVSNSLAIITLLKTPTIRDNVTIGLINLCVADLLVGLALIWCNSHDMVAVFHWNSPGQNILCSGCIIVCMATVHLSAFGLLVVAYERYMTIANPLNYMDKVTPRKMKIIIGVKWIWVLSLHVVNLFLAKLDEDILCYPNLLLPWYITDFAYLVNSAIPLFATIFLYIRIALLARRQQRAIADQNLSAGNVSEKKEYKIAKMMSIVVGGYAATWTPLIIIATVINHTEPENCPPELVVAQRVAYEVTVVNSFMNPIIYFWKMRAFRNGVKRLVGCHSSTVEAQGGSSVQDTTTN